MELSSVLWPQYAQQAGSGDRDPGQIGQAAGSGGLTSATAGARGERRRALALLFTKEEVSHRGENAFPRCELCSRQLRRGGLRAGGGKAGWGEGSPPSMHLRCSAEFWVGWSRSPGSFTRLTILRRQTEPWEVFV